MTVKELITALEKMPEDKIVILTEPDGIGWDNIGQVIEDGSTVKITMDGNHPLDIAIDMHLRGYHYKGQRITKKTQVKIARGFIEGTRYAKAEAGQLKAYWQDLIVKTKEGQFFSIEELHEILRGLSMTKWVTSETGKLSILEEKVFQLMIIKDKENIT